MSTTGELNTLQPGLGEPFQTGIVRPGEPQPLMATDDEVLRLQAPRCCAGEQHEAVLVLSHAKLEEEAELGSTQALVLLGTQASGPDHRRRGDGAPQLLHRPVL